MAFWQSSFQKNRRELRPHREAVATAAERQPPIIVVFGEGEFLRMEALRRIREAWLSAHPGGESVLLAADPGAAHPFAYSDLMAELGGKSLFAREKLVTLRRADRLLFPAGRRDDSSEPADEGPAGKEKGFLEYLAAPSSANWLLVECAALPRNRTVGKRLAEAGFAVPCPALAPAEAGEWLRERASGFGKNLEPAAVEMLVQAHGSALGTLAAELDKIALFAGDKESISVRDVGEFLTGAIEFEIFGLTNAVEAGDLREALAFARRIAVEGSRDQKGKKDDGERSAHRALAMLGSSVLGVLRARSVLAEGGDAADLAEAAGFSSWRAERLMSAAGKVSLPRMRAFADLLAGEVRKSHDTGGDAPLSLETAAVRLTMRDAL